MSGVCPQRGGLELILFVTWYLKSEGAIVEKFLDRAELPLSARGQPTKGFRG